MKNKAISLLKSLTEAHSVPGYEDEVRELFIQELVSLGEMSSDRMGGVYCERGNGPKILLAGHMDEVGFRVQNITHDGFIKIPSGGRMVGTHAFEPAGSGENSDWCESTRSHRK